MVIFWIFATVIVLVSFVYPKSKIIAALQLIMIWLLIGWNSGGMDFRGNEIIFYQSSISGFKGLRYGWLANLIGYYLQQNKLDFITYNIVITFFMVLLLGVIILKVARKPCLVINLFLIYPFLDCVVQKRFFWGMILIFVGIYFLMKKKRVFYLGCALLAIGFHFSFAIFIPLVFFDLLDEKKEKYFICFAIVAEILIIYRGEKLLQGLFNVAKLNRYLFQVSYSSVLIGVLYTVSILGYVFICEKATHGFQQNDRVLFFRKLNRLSVVLAPLCLYESVYMRYYRIILLWAYILICNENEYPLIKKGIIKISNRNIWVWTFILYLIILNAGIYLSSNSGIKGYLDTMLTNKLF